MQALVTGGAGFIGSHLAQRLLADGNRVTAIDNLSTGSLENIKSFRDNPKFDFVEGDIRDAGMMESLAERSDVIFHLAAAVGVQLIADDPVHTIETNVGGTETVLEAANRFGAKVLIASSSEVYGKSEAVPFNEDDDLVLGSTSMSRWAYACSKAADEFLGQAFHQQYGLCVVIGRFFNTIGPRQTGRYGMVVPRFVEKALKDEPVQIAAALASVLLRPGEPQPAPCSHLGRELGGIAPYPAIIHRLEGASRQLLLQEVADLLPEPLLLLGKREVHSTMPPPVYFDLQPLAVF